MAKWERAPYVIVIGRQPIRRTHMTIQTVPQDVYQRHEREWQMLREAIAKSQKKTGEPAYVTPKDRHTDNSKDTHQ